ncbi:SUMF1/EgtB/PvdO family nonheme iron enzyme [Agaribacter flavus]|uniref:SUMF1/EgtB/PvdO family nonheme iron enzyme n=1 Tax=Agaribacter flavus TaxID=1902781 RepID=A0ABV7FRY6_9ALTE
MEELDNRIKQAQRKGVLSYLLIGVSTSVLLVLVFTWLFFVKGYTLIVAPEIINNDYSTSVLSGKVFRRNNSLYILGTKASLRVSADKFEAVVVNITEDSPPNLKIELPPSPARIKVDLSLAFPPDKTASHSDKDANWYIDGTLIHVGNKLDYAIAHGAYRLRLEHPYYEPQEMSLDLAQGEVYNLSPELVSVKGSLDLSSSVNDALIAVSSDSFTEQESPYIRHTVEGGSYRVNVSAQGYQPISDTIDISWQTPKQKRQYILEPLQAKVQVSAVPLDGNLLINKLEKALGTHQVNASETIEIQYTKPGYYAFNEKFSLTPGETKTVNIKLKPAKGTLLVTTQPQAEVFVDNKRVGTSPVTITLPAVSHSVSVKKAGYRAVTQKLRVEANKQSTISVDLMTEFEARRAEGLPLFASTLGIEMRKFAGGTFTLGSAVNQPGRRRNEHQIEVDLQRPFWVSKHEITEKQYAAYLGQGSGGNKPIRNITWQEAAKFANWLSEKEGLPPFYRFQGNRLVSVNASSSAYRLPTEAEWEWLAKKAKRSVSTVYVWGNADKIPTNVGNFGDKQLQGSQAIYLKEFEDKHKGVADVGSYRADRLGLFDIAGNLSEWVHDRYTTTLPDTSKLYVDYMGPESGDLHVTKGGNYTTGRLRDLRAAYREPAGSASPTIGFRIARYD